MDGQCSVDRRDAVAKPLKARAGAEVSAPPAVVAHFDTKFVAERLNVDPGMSRACVLGHVRERFADREVRGGLDRHSESWFGKRDPELDRYRGVVGESGHRALESTVSQDGRMQAMG